MNKYIILHDVESGKEIRVNVLGLHVINEIEIGDWEECYCGSMKKDAVCFDPNSIKYTKIKWGDDNGIVHVDKVIETVEEIKNLISCQSKKNS